MSKKIQIENLLIAIDSIKYNLGLVKKSKIKNKYALKNAYDSIFFNLKIINKIISAMFEVENGK